MSELRKDYVLDRYVIINSGRKKRLVQFEAKNNKKTDLCVFCPGSEGMNPQETERVSDKNNPSKWIIRVFPNKYASINEEKTAVNNANEDITFSEEILGSCEVMVETPDHEKQLWDLSPEEINLIFKTYSSRITKLLQKKDNKYVVVFKNHGEKSGSSIVHSHTQIFALNKVPPVVEEETKKSFKQDRCLYCETIKKEKNSSRLCFENETMIAIAPYASRFSYEVWIFPKMHIKKFEQFSEQNYKDLSEMMNKVLGKLKTLNLDYNYFIHYAPDDKDLHFHVEIIPRMEPWGGFENSTGIIVNSVSPEDAAEVYRGKNKQE
ncbi:MAG: galactose-1-phosphate uridylyltransferase [Candidatus Nanoarchaeia archaeon]